MELSPGERRQAVAVWDQSEQAPPQWPRERYIQTGWTRNAHGLRIQATRKGLLVRAPMTSGVILWSDVDAMINGQGDLLNPTPTGSELRNAGIAKVDEAVSTAWKRKADSAIEELSYTREDFTADEVRAVAGAPPGHPNAMGARFAYAARLGIIARVGYRPSDRADRHRNPVAIWRGT
jgi:hypothetical protein